MCTFRKNTAPETAFVPFFSECRLSQMVQFTYAACFGIVGETGAPRGNQHQYVGEHTNSTQKLHTIQLRLEPGTFWL